MSIYLSKLSSLTKPSKYLKWYSNIINFASARTTSKDEAKQLLVYVEKHHILPKCLCENKTWHNDKENMVFLTAREHFVVHWLLIKMIKHQGLEFGFFMLSSRYKNGKSFESARKRYAQSVSDRKQEYTIEQKALISGKQKQTCITKYGVDYASTMNGMRDVNHTEDAKELIRKASANKSHSIETKNKLSKTRSKQNGNSTTFLITAPDGTQYRTKSIMQFCAEQQISYGFLHKQSNGYTVTNLKPAKWKIYHDDGSNELVHSLKVWCDGQKLNYPTAYSHYKNGTKYGPFLIAWIATTD